MNNPAVKSKDPGMLVYSRPSGIGLPGRSLFLDAVRRYSQSCSGLIRVPIAAPTVNASCTSPVCMVLKPYVSLNVCTTAEKKRNKIPQAKLIQSVKKITTGSVSSILVGRIKEILSILRTDVFFSSDSA